MVLQQDKGAGPPPFDTGLPRAQSQEDVPRWLVIIGIVAACTLLVALLRYAIDLLGVVFLIILVGFSIRAVSDWLTEGESVSGWALGAVFAGLFGTVVVGLWLFGSRDFSGPASDGALPAPIATATDWLEAHGWGQRVLLSGAGPVATAPAGQGGGSSASASHEAPPPPSTPIVPSRGERSSEPSRARQSERPSGGAGEAEAAPAESGSSIMPSASSGTADPSTASSPGQAPAGAPADPPQEAPSVGTRVSLSASQSTSVVGTSVRFTATVTTDGTPPSGVVVFYDGDRPMVSLAVHGTSGTVSVSYSSLDLAIGDHQITAVFHGTHAFLGSRSDPLTHSVTRR